jgi:hypothetical protein
MATPSLNDWLELSPDERIRRMAAFNAYAGEGGELVGREEMLHALVGRPFAEHLSNCRRWVEEGVIPPFE